MHESISLSEYFYLREKNHQDNQDFLDSHRKKLDRLKKASLTEISYPSFDKAYDYVHSLFPQTKIKDVTIYKVPVAIMEKMGFYGIEGFYSHLDHSVVICGNRKPSAYKGAIIKARIEKDEVIVHELLHYAYVAMGRWNVSSQMREEFAYGWSIGYLRNKGYTDDQIIEYNFLPYLFSIVYEDAIRAIRSVLYISDQEFSEYSSLQRREFFRLQERSITDTARQMAISQGHELIKLYSRLLEQGTSFSEDDEEVTRFELLDFDEEKGL